MRRAGTGAKARNAEGCGQGQGMLAALLALGWMLLNDTMDYGVGIYPWLPSVLEDDLTAIAGFTFVLSVVSYFLTLIVLQFRSSGETGAGDRR